MLLFVSAVSCNRVEKKAIDYVNPFIGTEGDHGQMFPGAALPFGMVKLSPDTYPSGFNQKAHSGFNYGDDRIMGFSHVRLGGEGCEGAGGNILVLPTIGKKEFNPVKYEAGYEKSSQVARPGYYKVRLKEPAIECELTVTPHAGFHRYTFPPANNSRILMDLGCAFTEIRGASIRIIGKDEVEGYVEAGHMCHSEENYKIYFSARLNRRFESFAVWDGMKFTDQTSAAGTQIGAVLNFETKPKEVILLKVGISTIDCQDAKRNRDSEIPDWDFDNVRQQAQSSWQAKLDRIEVMGSEEYKQIFYTALYHSYLMPANITSVDGRFRGTDDQISVANNYTHYDSWSIWDTFRTKYPLLTLTEPDIVRDCIQSFIHFYEHDYIVDPFPTVRREHMLSIIADAYTKGIREYDIQSAYQGMRKDALELRQQFGNSAAGVKKMMAEEQLKAIFQQYDACEFFPRKPDLTQEISYDNWCVAQIARELGKTDDYNELIRRANFFKNVWDPQVRFFRAKDEDGNWLEFSDPKSLDEKYIYEASGWQWRWFVPHDIEGLINLIGGKEKFIEELDQFFTEHLYNQGNEQDIHAPFLFNIAGAPWLTQKWVHTILTKPMKQLYGSHKLYDKPVVRRIFQATPDGYLPEMDDDCGTMSSWYVLSAMGLFQVCPSLPVYQLSTPIFEKTTIRLSDIFSGKDFQITTHNLSKENYYIQSARLNGKAYNRSWISYQDIVAGGVLEYELGPEPNKNWGVEGISDLPEAP